MNKELHNKLLTTVSIATVALTANATVQGAIVDSKDYQSLEFLISNGTITDGDHQLLIEQGDDSLLSDATVTPSELILGDVLSLDSTDSDSVVKIGTIGKSRYHRLSIVSTNVTTGAASLQALALQSDPFNSEVVPDS